jgi:hypothetical protein
MNTILAAYRINGKETTVFISFSLITNNGLKSIESRSITNSKGEIGVIFHIQNDSQTRLNAGTDTVSFKADFKIDTDRIRVFYWNDTDALSDNLSCFEDFLEKNGLDENVLHGDFDCPKSNNKAILIPRQSGNGGVLGIQNLP